MRQAPALERDCWEWQRDLLHPDGRIQRISCCPEDLELDPKTCNGHDTHVLCRHCRIPLCHSCATLLSSKTGAVPMCLANDNYIGYIPEMLIKLKVRWIEAAIASPVWTTMIVVHL